MGVIDDLFSKWMQDGGQISPEAIAALQQGEYDREMRTYKEAGRERASKEQQATEGRRSSERIANRQESGAMARLTTQLGFNREELQAKLQMARDELGFNRERLAAEVEQARQKLELDRQTLEVTRGKAYADAWYQQQEVQLARESRAIERGKLGLDVVDRATKMASDPSQYFQSLDEITQLAGNPQVSGWLADMAAGAQAGGFSGYATNLDAGRQAITPQQAMGNFMSMLGAGGGQDATAAAAPAWLAQNPAGGGVPPTIEQMQATAPFDANGNPVWLGGAGAAPPTAPQQAVALSPQLQAIQQQRNAELAKIGVLADAGGHALAPGALEKAEAANPGSTAMFVSGLQKLRRNAPAWLNQYKQAQPYQGGVGQVY